MRYHCGFCQQVLVTRAALHIHKARQHRLQYGAGRLQDPPFSYDDNPFQAFPDAGEI